MGTVLALIGSLRVWGGRDARDVFAKNHGKENCVNLGKTLVLLGGECFTRQREEDRKDLSRQRGCTL